MKCLRCGTDTVKKEGKVYGQPQQKSEFYECKSCGMTFNTRITGVRIFDETEMKTDASRVKKRIVDPSEGS